jgi:hypothetical protein
MATHKPKQLFETMVRFDHLEKSHVGVKKERVEA